MTRPRIVDPGATLALSRRTTRRHFLLNPDEARQMEQVYWYCLAYGSELARERIADRVRDRQHQAWNKAKRTGLAFVGPRRVLRLAHTKRARSYEVFGSLNPQFAAAGNRAAATDTVKRLRVRPDKWGFGDEINRAGCLHQQRRSDLCLTYLLDRCRRFRCTPAGSPMRQSYDKGQQQFGNKVA